MKTLIEVTVGIALIAVYAAAVIASVALPILGCIWLWNNI